MAVFGADAISLDWDFAHTAGSINGEIESFDGVGLIRLDVTAGVTYNFSATTFGIYANDATIRVYDASGNQLQYTGLGSYTSVLAYSATASGTVYVGVGNVSGSPGPYDLFISTSGWTNKILDYNDNTYTGLANERILAGNGDDIITLGAATEAFGSGGDDYLQGNNVGNRISGGAGNDYISLGTGNNTAWGNAGVDQIYGSSGVDLIFGGDDADRLSGYGNNDTIRGGNHADAIYGGAGSDKLYGDAGNDRINGDDGNDLIVGGSGLDQMAGGPGDDRFYVDNFADKVFEAADAGNDTVYSSVTYTLTAGQHIEMLSTTAVAGTTAMNLAGNELAQRVNGNEGANTLSGIAGNDTLVGYGGADWLKGGLGSDTLYGGSGNDNFVFDATLGAANVDQIMDFSVPSDTIYLDNAVMTGLGATLGTLSAAKFWKSTAGVAHDSDDRIIYDIDTGRLFYDANGIASGGATHFATLAPNLALTNADFVVF